MKTTDQKNVLEPRFEVIRTEECIAV